MLSAWLILNAVETAERIVSYYNPLPLWDYWRVPESYLRYRALDIRCLWRQHNEHRIIFPEIVFAIDALLWQGREFLPLIASFLAYFCTWALFSRVLFADESISSIAKTAGALLAGVVMFWEGSATVLASPFLLQWTMTQLAVVCALFFLARVKAGSNAYLFISIFCAVVATYSSSNGLITWPLLIMASLILNLGRGRTIIIATSALLFGGMYFVGYTFLARIHFAALLQHPLYTTAFVGSYFSMPFSMLKPVQFGVAEGLVSLAVTVLLTVIVVRKRWLAFQLPIVYLGYYCFTLFTVLLIAGGRMDPNDPLYLTAKSGRYLVSPLSAWAIFILFNVWVCGRLYGKVPALALTCVFAVLAFPGFRSIEGWFSEEAEGIAEAQVATLSVQNDLFDETLVRKIFPRPLFVSRYLPVLREHKLAIYHRARDRWLGKPLTSFSPLQKKTIAGEIALAYPVHSGAEIAGWAEDVDRQIDWNWIVLTNESGEIAGFGERIPAAFPKSMRSPRIAFSAGWVGFVNGKFATDRVSAYVIDSRKSGAYPIQGAVSFPKFQAAAPADIGPPIPGVTWRGNPIWTAGPGPTGTDLAQPAGTVYNSWSGSDDNTGDIASSVFDAPPNGCVIMPVLHGPSSIGLSLDLLDAQTGQSIASAPMRDDDHHWRFWRVPLDGSVKQLRIIAHDGGRDWGQWIAVADPHQCRQ